MPCFELLEGTEGHDDHLCSFCEFLDTPGNYYPCKGCRGNDGYNCSWRKKEDK